MKLEDLRKQLDVYENTTSISLNKDLVKDILDELLEGREILQYFGTWHFKATDHNRKWSKK